MKDRAPQSLDESSRSCRATSFRRQKLWPRIVREIIRPPGGSRPVAFAAAASVAAACLATALTWAVLHGRPASIQRGRRPASVAASFDEPRDAAYVAARAVIQQTFHERLALLDPGHASQIESSLAVIRQAREDIRRDLAAPRKPDPRTAIGGHLAR